MKIYGQHLSPNKMLPHSYPFVLIDRIIEFEEDKRIVCLKNITINEKFFQGHFGDNPIFPAIFIIEAMAQTSGLIIGGKGSRMAYLSSIMEAKFMKPVIPGDQLIITSSLFHRLPPLYVFEVQASVNDEMVSEAEIIMALV